LLTAILPYKASEQYFSTIHSKAISFIYILNVGLVNIGSISYLFFVVNVKNSIPFISPFHFHAKYLYYLYFISSVVHVLDILWLTYLVPCVPFCILDILIMWLDIIRDLLFFRKQFHSYFNNLFCHILHMTLTFIFLNQ
jgi:hypothetical protein